MAFVSLKGLRNPIQNSQNSWTGEFESSDPTKPLIKIQTIHIDPSSDAFDPTKIYIGLVIYSCHGRSRFTLNKVDYKTGDIYIKETDWIETNVPKRRKRGDYYHGRLFYSIFKRWKRKRLQFVGGGFGYKYGELRFNSGTFNTMNPNNNNDGYHDTNRELNRFEKQLIQNVFDYLYKNHCWLKRDPTDRVSLQELNRMRMNNNIDEEEQCSADFSQVHVDRKLHGVVIMVNNRRGYGFIKCLGFDDDLFVHCSDVTDRPNNESFLMIKEQVEFNIIKGHRGWKAKNVTIISTGKYFSHSNPGGI